MSAGAVTGPGAAPAVAAGGLAADGGPTAEDPVLEVRNLSVDYGFGDDPTHVLRDVSLTLRRGEVLGLAGESGCGKSTLAYAATRLLAPPGLITGGEVWLTNRDGKRADLLALSDAELRAARWRDIAIVFQGAMSSLNPVFRVEKQLVDGILAHRPRMGRGEARERAAELLRLVGISTDRLRAYPHQLSGGMRQRVMIAMALALEPQVLIMDEPTTALDVVMQRQILEQVMELRERLGFSVVLITHDVSLLVEVADRIAVMYAGEIVETAAARDVYTHPRHPYSAGLLGSFPPLHGPRRDLSGIPGAPPDLSQREPGCPFAPRCPHVMDVCRTELPVLGRTAQAEDGRLVACHLHTSESAKLPDLVAR
ncbi:ABC transporter ATP-binding protein [Promicromonospora sp. NPDC060204]|uniref:ABC transporter ATP-binding protein n=1 Tax=Promicromonospora sp. NPDC060204 TaxID=3347071 RepID=UPI00365FDADE